MEGEGCGLDLCVCARGVCEWGELGVSFEGFSLRVVGRNRRQQPINRGKRIKRQGTHINNQIRLPPTNHHRVRRPRQITNRPLVSQYIQLLQWEVRLEERVLLLISSRQ